MVAKFKKSLFGKMRMLRITRRIVQWYHSKSYSSACRHLQHKVGGVLNKERSGMVSVEFALVLPLLLAVAALLVNLLVQAGQSVAVEHAAREVARAYSLDADKVQACELVTQLRGKPAKCSIEVVQAADLPVQQARVTVKQPGVGVLALVGYSHQAQYVVLVEP